MPESEDFKKPSINIKLMPNMNVNTSGPMFVILTVGVKGE